MLELKHISKKYETLGFNQQALNDINLKFRKNEFVSILGPSGSGKTTLLNIIGGLDKYTSGDLVINGISTKKYDDNAWDAYRNNCIGFVFQSYNLIPHQSILENVSLALTLSGTSKKEIKKRSIEALKKVGLEDHINKKPNQLSGGQMQRVAIARALVNNPDILLADEPTGALDSKTSVEVMNLLKEVAKDRLVIMVTHNKELAENYSTRIIELHDGVITSDSNPFDDLEETSNVKIKKKKNMSFKTAFNLSLNNLLTKKGRTFLTAFAGSIGIIGIALILSLSSGVNNYIKKVQEEALTSYPIMIEKETVDLTSLMLESSMSKKDDNQDNNKIYSNDMIQDTFTLMSSNVSSNNLEKFKEYLDNNKEIDDLTSMVDYGYNLDLQIYKNDAKDIVKVNPNTVLDNIGMGNSNMMVSSVFSKMFDDEALNKAMYEVVEGRLPKKYNEIVLVVDKNNKIADYTLYALGLKDQKELKEIYNKVLKGEKVETTPVNYTFDEILDLSFKLVLNTDYYEKINGIYVDKSGDEKYLKDLIKNGITLDVVGIVKPNSDAAVEDNTLGEVLYTKELEDYVIEQINKTDIVKDQKKNKEVSVLTGLKFSNEEFDFSKLSYEQQMMLQNMPAEELADLISKYKERANLTYEKTLELLGARSIEDPSSIYIYPKDFESKERIKEIISLYNEEQKEEDVINYSDLVGILMSSVTSIVDIISYVLIGFVSISLVVSSIMIGIITYISVLERTKEIGILRAIGASKKDVSRVFNAETLIVGLSSGILGILTTIILNIPINIIISSVAGVSKISSLPIMGGVILIIISVVLTIIAGLIPSRVASKKDPVESLRSE